MLPSLIDRYVLGARVAPVVVITSSIFLAVSAWIPVSEWPVKLLGGSVVLGIVAFILAQLTRDAGKLIEPALWAAWDGPPSVRFLRHRDPTVPIGSKAAIHRRLVELGIVDRLPSKEDEEGDQVAADEAYRTCSDWLRRKAIELKAKSPFDVVHSENISYGFRRNLLGIRPYGLPIVLGAAVLAAAAFWPGRRPYIELALILFVLVFLVFGVNASFVKRAAEGYAKRLLDAVQSLSPPARSTSRKPTAASKGKSS